MRASKRAGSVRLSSIRRMVNLSAKMEDIIHLEQGEPNFTTPQHILDAAVEAVKKGFTHYTDTSGTLELRHAIAEKLEKENGICADPETEIVVTCGSQEAMLVAALCLLDPGDQALVIDPYYPAYSQDILLASGIPVSVPLDANNNYKIDMEVLEKKLTNKTKMIWICNPSNPTGHVFSKSDLECLAEVAKKHDLTVFSDEIYEKIVYDGVKPYSIASFPGMEERTITVQGFSKAYAMTGWRIGYMVAYESLALTLRTLHYYATLCPNIISQKAAYAALTSKQTCVQEMLAEYTRRRELVMNELKKIESLPYTEPKGAFYVFPDFTKLGKSDEELAVEILKKTGVVTVPGSGFGKAGEGHLRISYSTSYEKVKEGMKRISSYLESDI
jgi:aminotransferase